MSKPRPSRLTASHTQIEPDVPRIQVAVAGVFSCQDQSPAFVSGWTNLENFARVGLSSLPKRTVIRNVPFPAGLEKSSPYDYDLNPDLLND